MSAPYLQVRFSAYIFHLPSNDQLQLVAHTVKEGADGKQEEGTSNAE